MSLTPYGWSVVDKILDNKKISWVEKQHLRKAINPSILQSKSSNPRWLENQLQKLRVALYS